jgi:hypothetical protein
MPNQNQIVLPNQQQAVMQQQAVIQQQNLQVTNFTHILVVHIISNSIMNITNIVASKNSVETNRDEMLQVLILFYFCKLFFNYVILMYSKSHIERIEDCLVVSYTYQMVLFGFLIYALSKMKTDSNFIILIINNVLLGFGDLAFRIIIERRIQNTVVVG